jgi:hypothetical protein
MAGSENKPGIVYISRYVMIVSLLLFLTAASSFGQVSRATLPFLLMAPDARGRSMGEGGSVFATGAVAAFYNPASIVSVTTAAGEFNYFKPMPSWENNLYALNIYAAFALPNSLRFAVGMNRLDYGTFELIGPYGEILWRYEYYDFAISAYSAVDFDSLSSVGIGIKYIYSQAIADWTGGNLGLADGNILAADFGMLFRNRFRNLTYTSSNYTFPEIRKWARTRDNRGLSFGISVANLGPKVSYGAEANILYLFNLRGGRYFDTIGRQRMWMIGWGIGPEWLHFDYSRTYDTEDNWPSKDGAYSLSLYCNLPSGILRWF